jgi:hypothetical protein
MVVTILEIVKVADFVPPEYTPPSYKPSTAVPVELPPRYTSYEEPLTRLGEQNATD